MSATAARNYQGPAVLSGGFRLFFLAGALYAGLSILLWVPQFYGTLELASAFSAVDWHIHEIYFGYLPAVITGFLFTAVPNWTGRMPVRGKPLLSLFLVWVAGRVAIGFSAVLPWWVVLVIDGSFVALIAAVVAKEIVAGRNWRNLKVLGPVLLLAAANGVFHVEAHVSGASDYSRRTAITAVLLLVMIIGGRIIPSFTRNWLARENPGRLPVPFSRFDLLAILIALIAMTAWIVGPYGLLTGVLMVIASVLQGVRLWRWAGYRTFGESLVFTMHISYLFIPIGFALIGAGVFWPERIAQLAGVHALGLGAIGAMTLTIMVRASLGHTGQRLHAGAFVNALYGAIFAAAAARILAGLEMGPQDGLLHIAAFGWAFAFIGFAARFAPALLTRRHKTV